MKVNGSKINEKEEDLKFTLIETSIMVSSKIIVDMAKVVITKWIRAKSIKANGIRVLDMAMANGWFAILSSNS